MSILPNSPEITLKGNPEKVLVSWDFVVGWKGSSVGFWCVWVCVWGGVGVGVGVWVCVGVVCDVDSYTQAQKTEVMGSGSCSAGR